jgi:hypothetical protein
VNASDTPADGTLLALAGRLADSAGLGHARALSRLTGGKNNQVYRIDVEAGAPLVIKRYFSDPRDGRDRLATEWDFLQRAWQNGVRAIPQPLLRDAALYTFVPGRKLAPAELDTVHVDAAADFIVAINTHVDTALIPPASEACFSIADHLNIVERRLSRLATLDPQASRAAEAASFSSATLRPAWDAVKSKIARETRALRLDMNKPLASTECCLSPSDFGFHNALAADGRLVFLDFEYAGRDDPAKLVVDFFCQPAIPVPLQHLDRFTARLSEGLRFDPAASTRCALLLDVCRIKWVCIVLNDFLPVGAARRSFADPAERDARCARQIEKAKAKLGEMIIA